LADGETNITLAFYKAGYHVEQENYWSIHYKEQKPIMDDNGDGTGSRYTDISYTDTNKDGTLAPKPDYDLFLLTFSEKIYKHN